MATIVLLFSISAFGQWKMLDAGTDSNFRGLDVVSKNIVWASGTGGTVIRTSDSGKTWKVIKVPGAEKLDLRDIEAFDDKTAYVLSIGSGDSSRIYKTTDGGDTWTLQFRNTVEDAFFDSIAFWDETHGIAQSDPVNGKYLLARTVDGKTWKAAEADSLPPAASGEAAFAASGTSIIAYGDRDLFLVTGGSDARVLFSRNRGKTWTSTDAPLASGEPGAGVFGIAIRGKRGIIVGGNYTKPEANAANIAYSTDGGKTWKTRRKENPFGYRSGVTFVTGKMVVIVGSGGSDISQDFGETWEEIDKGNWNSVDSKGKEAVFAVGPGGRVGQYEFRD